jgi:uncharacterized membrane-anchored protein YhcB (DUF1043 family)
MQITLQSVVMAIALLIASVLTLLIEKLRKENKRDHGYVRERLDDINDNVKQVNTRLEKHIDWHIGESARVDPPVKKRAARKASPQS